MAATEGILRVLNDDELEGVIAHELAHVKHRDILISSIAATLAAAIMMVARFAMFFGGSRDDDNARGQPDRAPRDDDPGAAGGDAHPGGHLALARVRRRRGRRGHRRAARMGWSSALRQDRVARSRGVPLDANPATAHMFIIKPFSGGWHAVALQHPSADRGPRSRADAAG